MPSEAHALILEANLIKEYQPKYNIALRDDKSYPYIKVTVAEPFPRVWVTRHLVDDGSRYFGPYTDVGAMRRALNVVKRIFTVRSCNYDMPKQMPERPCLDYYIKRCKAPCILAQTQGEYRAMIDEVLVFLDGRTQEVVRARARAHGSSPSESLDFERAAELRDALKHLEQMEEPTVVHDDRRRRPRRGRLSRATATTPSWRSCAFAAASCWRASTSSSRTSRRRPTARCSRRIWPAKYLPLEDRASGAARAVRSE